MRTAKPRQAWWQAVNNKGYLLAETCIALAVAGIAAVIFYNGLSGFALSWKSLQSDLLLYRAARYSQGFIAQELLLNAQTVKITTGKNDKIVCGEIRGNRQVTFYVSGGALAREIKYNSTRGVNPLSLTEVTLEALKAERSAPDKIKVTLQLKDNASGRRKNFTEVYSMANGSF